MKLAYLSLKYRPKNKNVINITRRSLSYIERCRYVQKIKEDRLECLQLLPKGKFLVHKGSQPLLKSNHPSSSQGLIHRELSWLSYVDVTSHSATILQSFVLLDVDNDKIPRFGVQLEMMDDSIWQSLEEKNEASFTDLRTAFFTVNWKDAHTLSRANALIKFNRNNTFCGRCGKMTKRNAPGDSRWCLKCETYFHPYSNPVGIVLVTDPLRDHALLVRQPKHPPGMFSCIAGFADVGESLEETVKREVAEEVGLEVEEVEYAASQHWPFPGSLMAGCYAVTQKSELNIDTSELESGKWFTRKEIGDAIHRIRNDRFLSFNGNPNGEFIIPPPGAIAYHLIYHWFQNTPVKEIYRQIK